MVKTIQMTIDERLLARVDEVTAVLDVSRSAFIREALEYALERYAVRRMEEQDAAGYAALPAQPDETARWINEQVWGDEWNAGK